MPGQSPNDAQMKTTKILVTGANGLLGQKLVDRLSGRPAVEVIATGRGGNRNPNSEGYAYAEIDAVVQSEVDDVMGLYSPDVVVHAAAMTNVDQCELKPDECWELNVKATENIVRACEKVGAKIVHVSTDFIFDGKEGPYSEKATPNPLSHYGRSKWAAEQIVMGAQVPWAIARTMLVYGVVADMSRSNIVLWAKKALESGQQIKVVDDQFRSPTLVEDLADGIIHIIMKGRTGVYNLSGPEQMSILDMVKQVADFWKLDAGLITPVDSGSLNQPAARPPKTGFIILKAQTELGYRPRTVREGLAVVDKQLNLFSLG